MPDSSSSDLLSLGHLRAACRTRRLHADIPRVRAFAGRGWETLRLRRFIANTLVIANTLGMTAINEVVAPTLPCSRTPKRTIPHLKIGIAAAALANGHRVTCGHEQNTATMPRSRLFGSLGRCRCPPSTRARRGRRRRGRPRRPQRG
jgi:hypothetical protein